ncbi:hypothetical protein T492DRAFT_865821 [Pavlovales sp. CCMP2436]|nr:hypothetical protein T492DRAFT_865821 [Pavlovales sp. CCMP2436]
MLVSARFCPHSTDLLLPPPSSASSTVASGEALAEGRERESGGEEGAEGAPAADENLLVFGTLAGRLVVHDTKDVDATRSEFKLAATLHSSADGIASPRAVSLVAACKAGGATGAGGSSGPLTPNESTDRRLSGALDRTERQALDGESLPLPSRTPRTSAKATSPPLAQQGEQARTSDGDGAAGSSGEETDVEALLAASGTERESLVARLALSLPDSPGGYASFYAYGRYEPAFLL